MLVLHRRGRRESLTRLGLKDLTPGKIICLFWESELIPPEAEPIAPGAGKVLSTALVMSRHLQLTEGLGQRDHEQMQVSVELWYPRA